MNKKFLWVNKRCHHCKIDCSTAILEHCCQPSSCNKAHVFLSVSFPFPPKQEWKIHTVNLTTECRESVVTQCQSAESRDPSSCCVQLLFLHFFTCMCIRCCNSAVWSPVKTTMKGYHIQKHTANHRGTKDRSLESPSFYFCKMHRVKCSAEQTLTASAPPSTRAGLGTTSYVLQGK